MNEREFLNEFQAGFPSPEKPLTGCDEDEDLGRRVDKMVSQRNAALTLAQEMLSTLLLPQNVEHVPPKLRELADTAWKPQLLAVVEGRALSDEEIDVALAASGIDVEPALERVRAAIAKTPAGVRQEREGQGCSRP